MSLQLSGSKPRQLQYIGTGLRRDLRLLELDEALLAEIQLNGVVIKGGTKGGDDAVLCTDDRTFALKYVETTNTLLLLPPDQCGDDAFGGIPSLTPPADASLTRDVGLQTQLVKATRAEDNPPLVATATAVAHIEVARCLPRLTQLRDLLKSSRPYGIEDEQTDMQVDDAAEPRWKQQIGKSAAAAAAGSSGAPLGFTTAQLLELVQCSRAELLAELAALRAVSLAGRWRLVDEEYLGRLLEVVLLSATEYGWSLGAVPVEEACTALQADGYKPELVRHCLAVHGSPADKTAVAAAAAGAGRSQSSGAGAAAAVAGAYALDRASVCLHFARKLMHQRGQPQTAAAPGGGNAATGDASAGAAAGADGSGGGGALGWRRSHFFEAWADAVPEEWSPPDESLLAGEALVELPEGSLPGTEPSIVPFAARELPLDPAARFAALFRRRPRWEQAELEPYLAALVSGATGSTVETLLLRHARASQLTPDAPVLFSARF